MSAVIKSLSSTAAEEAEWALRVDMAAVFRVSARLGWNEQIGNHNSIMLPQARPDDKPTFLINPRVTTRRGAWRRPAAGKPPPDRRRGRRSGGCRG